MQDLVFYILAGLTLLCGLMVVANPFSRNPVTSAMFLVLTIVCMAGLFVLLNAFFLAAVQVLVYAGAVMVLFLFVIMLLDIKEEERRKIKVAGIAMSVLAVGALGAILVCALWSSNVGVDLQPAFIKGETRSLGVALFGPRTQWLLPFEIISVLLLVAMIGVILLSKKDLK
jgi:NADH-quinone oxidoreductase subunit J